jgi:GT2 family glycosyltransferase
VNPSARVGPNPVGPNSSDQSTHALTVIIVSYNCRDLLRACLSSLQDQTGAPDVRVVVTDNASTDSTLDMVREQFPWVTLVANAENIGFGRASNRGLHFASSGHVLMLNPDTVLPHDGIARALEALRQRPSVGVLGCKLVQADGTVDHASRRQIPTPLSSLAYMLKTRRGVGDAAQYTDPSAYDSEGPVGDVNGAFMLLRDQVVREVGGFDETFWMYGEDLDLCLRVTQAGWEIYYWPELEVLHVKGGSSGRSRTLRVNWAFHQAMWIFYRKHYAKHYGALVTGLVATAITGKFVLSVLRNILLQTRAVIRPRLTRRQVSGS